MDLDGEEGFAPFGSGGDGGDLTSSSGDGWESVARPAPLFLAFGDRGRGWEMVVPGRGALAYDDGCSVFPPCEHEGLLVEEGFMAAPEGGGATGSGENDPASVPSSPPFSSASSSSFSSYSRSSSFSSFVPSSGGGGREAWRTVRCEWAKRSFVELARRAVRSGYELLYLTLRRSRAGGGFDGVKHGAVWSSAAVAALAALLLLSVRRRYQREKLRLLLLMQEKDQARLFYYLLGSLTSSCLFPFLI
ncbi:hypothetical protein Taro_048939 [Colocasia esculenta]|uniref:Uncharacterized protein n=1 Tax=Colocasia esculenta TaxID=4460 RepID=A0A843X9H8_COLES|nr:hypothetical protein [Colocasia esculenta]